MPLKKLDFSIKKKAGGGGLKKIDFAEIERKRQERKKAAKALDFVEPVRGDVLADIGNDLTPEEANAARMEALDAALNDKGEERAKTNSATIKADLKRQGEAFKNQGSTDYYCCVVFADGAALGEFLKKVNYPDPDAIFLDGYLLAEALGIELPRPKFELQKIRPPQRTLSRLVTAFPSKRDKQA